MARARRPHRLLTAPRARERPARSRGPGRRKNLERRSRCREEGRLCAGRGNFCAGRVAGSGRGLQRLESQQERFMRNGPGKGRWPIRPGNRSRDRRRNGRLNLNGAAFSRSGDIARQRQRPGQEQRIEAGGGVDRHAARRDPVDRGPWAGRADRVRQVREPTDWRRSSALGAVAGTGMTRLRQSRWGSRKQRTATDRSARRRQRAATALRAPKGPTAAASAVARRAERARPGPDRGRGGRR
jgi:hypothetical protein